MAQRTIEIGQSASSWRKTSKSRYGVVTMPMNQPVISHGRNRRKDPRRQFSTIRTVNPEAGVPKVVELATSPDSTRGHVFESAKSTLTPHDHFAGSTSPLPTRDLFQHSDAEEIDSHPQPGIVAVLNLVERGYSPPYDRMDVSQGPRDIFPLEPAETPTLEAFKGSQEVSLGEGLQIELGASPTGYGVFNALSSEPVSNERRNPQGLSSTLKQPPSPGLFPSLHRVFTPDREIGLGSVSLSEEPLPAGAGILIEELSRHLISDLYIGREVDRRVRFTRADAGRSIAAEKLSEFSGQHQLARQFALGIDGEAPTPSVVRMVDHIVKAVEAKTKDCVCSVDEDGAFSFEGWLSTGQFVMCEVDLYGEINAGLYHSPTGPQESFLSCITEEELLDIL